MRRLRVAGRRTAAMCPAVVAAVVCAVFVAPVAARAEPDLAPVMLVLDASGSMKETLAAGGDRMTAAKTAVHTLVRQAPDGARLGLAVYGAGTGNAAADKTSGCTDVKVVHKVGVVDRAALATTVDGVQPRGYTPIGHSLRVAAAELPAEGRRSIVLVSDGEDTCAPPDPCEVARELANRGVDLRVHAVGFAVDARARRQLACLAQATGGTYVDAPDAATLASALNRVTQQALRAYQPVGTPVTGSKTPDGAPTLRPGAYLDRIGVGESRYYAVDVPAGYTLHASATGVMPAGNEYFLRVIRYDGEECTRPASSRATTTRAPAVSAALRWDAPPAASAATRPCDRAGQQVVRVWLDPVRRSGQTTGDAALEVLIGLEPPLAGDGGPPATKDEAVFTAPTGRARPVVGGGSFSTAAALDGAGAHTDTVVNGEMVFYRVRLDWGQGLAYRLRLAAKDKTFNGVNLKSFWYNPARSLQETNSVLYTGKETTLPSTGPAVSGPPVRFRNREVSGYDGGTSLAGWYYIAIWVEGLPSDGPVPVPVTLDVSVTGNTQPAPGYAAGAGSDPFGGLSAAGGRRSGAAGENAGGIWSTVADAGPLLWFGLPLLVLLSLGGLLVAVVVLRRRATRHG